MMKSNNIHLAVVVNIPRSSNIPRKTVDKEKTRREEEEEGGGEMVTHRALEIGTRALLENWTSTAVTGTKVGNRSQSIVFCMGPQKRKKEKEPYLSWANLKRSRGPIGRWAGLRWKPRWALAVLGTSSPRFLLTRPVGQRARLCHTLSRAFFITNSCKVRKRIVIYSSLSFLLVFFFT